jgi:hypothetical protein
VTARVVLAIAIAAAVAARVLAWFALRDVPHVMDEFVYLFQAKVLSGGHITAPALEPRAAFSEWFVEDRGARYGIFPPGWPAVLAVASWFGLERWIGPLLHGATVVLVGRGAGKIERSSSIIAAAIYGASPQALLLAASLMSHTLVAACAAVVLVASVEIAVGEASRRVVIAAGIALGVAAATRPLCGLVLAAAFAIAVAWKQARAAEIYVTTALAAAPVLVLAGAYFVALTGSLSRTPQGVWFDTHLPPADVPFFRYQPGCNDLGISASHGCDRGIRDAAHTIGNALSNTGDNLESWFLLACGPMIVVGIAVALVRRRQLALVLLAAPVLAIVAYALYWNAGASYGARFYQAALPAALVVVALGIVSTKRIGYALLAATLAWNAFALTRVTQEIRAWPYWGTDDRYTKLRAKWDRGRAVVMVMFGEDDVESPKLTWATHLGASTWIPSIRAMGALGLNGPRVDDQMIVFAKFHPALVPALRARFPKRGFYFYVDHADQARDQFGPFAFDDPRADPALFELPAENFDGFRLVPPERELPPLFRAPQPVYP